MEFKTSKHFSFQFSSISLDFTSQAFKNSTSAETARLKKRSTYDFYLEFEDFDNFLHVSVDSNLFVLKKLALFQVCFRTCRFVNKNKLSEKVAFFEPFGLYDRILNFHSEHFGQIYFEDQLCTYQIYCYCQNYRNTTRRPLSTGIFSASTEPFMARCSALAILVT